MRRNFGLRSPTKAAYSQQRWLAMPHAVEEFAPGPPSPQNGALLAAGSLGKDLGRVSMMAAGSLVGWVHGLEAIWGKYCLQCHQQAGATGSSSSLFGRDLKVSNIVV